MTIHIYTDGGLRPDKIFPAGQGHGGTGYVAVDVSNGESFLFEGATHYPGPVTNQRMELLAAIEGLSALKQPCRVILTSDSKYLVDAVTKGWVYGWQKKGWKKSDNSPALNVDLWERLLPLLKIHEVEFVWVKGHAGHPENERCDRLAVAWYQNYQAGCAAKISE